MYSSILESLANLGESILIGSIKNRVLTAFPDLTTLAQGREVLLVLSHEIGDVLLEAKNRDSDSIYEALKIHGATRENL